MTTSPALPQAPADTPSHTPAPAAGRPPVAPPAAGYVGATAAVVLIALGVVALRVFAAAMGWLHGSSWTAAGVRWFDGLSPQAWMPAAGIAFGLLGLWVLYAAVRPRRQTAVAVPAQGSVWIAPRDLARLATAAAQAVPGVIDVKSSGGRRRITIKADVTATDPNIRAAIQAAASSAVAGYTTSAPRITVRTRIGDI